MPNSSFPANSPLSNSVKVLIAGSLSAPDVSDYLTGVLRQLADSAITSVRSGGADFRFVEASAPDRDAGAALEGMDALLVLGGADADPTCYGQQPETDTMYGIDPEADRFELALMREASARGMPVLGICRGMQLMNILHGGDLVQEIGPGTMHNSSVDNSIMTSHPVTLAPGSRLGAIYDGRTLSVRSGHHQAVDRVGEGLVVTARSADGIVEALEAEGPQWMVGVQWHPEDPEAPREDLDLLIADFVAAARVRQSA